MNDLKTRILAAVEKDLEKIEKELTANLDPHLDLVREVAGHLLFAGGKRLRPLLMILAARACGCNSRSVYRFATIFEYLHAATLLHDDLVDGGAMRRGKPSAHTVWDPPTAVLTGDFLLARSLSIAASAGLPELIGVIANITENMSQGEIQQLDRKGALDMTEQEYYTVIKRKTAVLFQGACRAGAMIAGKGQNRQQALAAYGYHLGMAFQMADDLLDYTQSSKTLGKVPGADLREGKLTLPVIHALEKAGDDDYKLMCRTISGSGFSREEFEILVHLLNVYGGIAYTRARAGEHIRLAKQALSGLDKTKALEVMNDIADYALDRKL